MLVAARQRRESIDDLARKREFDDPASIKTF